MAQGSGSETQEYKGPPAPAMSARRVGARVDVTYEFAAMPDDCRPAFLKVRVDNRRDPVSGFGRIVRLTRSRGTVRLQLRSYVRRPDLLTASAVTRDGRPSNGVRLRVAVASGP